MSSPYANYAAKRRARGRPSIFNDNEGNIFGLMQPDESAK